MIPRSFALVCLAVAALAVAGCQTVNTSQRAEPQARPDVVDDQRIVTDSSLADKAAIVNVSQGRVGSTGLLKVQAELVNRTSSRQRINYRFEWFDQAGMRVDTPMSRWTQVAPAGRETVWISDVAPTPDVVDYQLKLIEAAD